MRVFWESSAETDFYVGVILVDRKRPPMKTLRKLVEYFFILSVRFACVIKSQILQHAQLATARIDR